MDDWDKHKGFNTFDEWIAILPDNFVVTMVWQYGNREETKPISEWRKEHIEYGVIRACIDWDVFTARLETLCHYGQDMLYPDYYTGCTYYRDMMKSHFERVKSKKEPLEDYEKKKMDAIIENNEWYAKLLIDSKQENCEEEIETALCLVRWLKELKERRKQDGNS